MQILQAVQVLLISYWNSCSGSSDESYYFELDSSELGFSNEESYDFNYFENDESPGGTSNFEIASIVDDGYKCEKEECGFQKTCLPWRGCQSKACEEDLTCQYLYGSGCVCKDGKCHYACKEDSGCSWGFKCHNQTCVKQDGGGGGVSPTMLEPPMEEPTMKQQMSTCSHPMCGPGKVCNPNKNGTSCVIRKCRSSEDNCEKRFGQGVRCVRGKCQFSCNTAQDCVDEQGKVFSCIMNTCVAETSVREAKECECQCMEAMELKKTFPPNIEVGDCKRKSFSGKLWCYIRDGSLNQCSHAEKDSLGFWSYDACNNARRSKEECEKTKEAIPQSCGCQCDGETEKFKKFNCNPNNKYQNKLWCYLKEGTDEACEDSANDGKYRWSFKGCSEECA